MSKHADCAIKHGSRSVAQNDDETRTELSIQMLQQLIESVNEGGVSERIANAEARTDVEILAEHLDVFHRFVEACNNEFTRQSHRFGDERDPLDERVLLMLRNRRVLLRLARFSKTRDSGAVISVSAFLRINEDGMIVLDTDDPIALALIGAQADLIRQCADCPAFFFAAQENSTCCSSRCRNRVNKCRSRAAQRALSAKNEEDRS